MFVLLVSLMTCFPALTQRAKQQTTYRSTRQSHLALVADNLFDIYSLTELSSIINRSFLTRFDQFQLTQQSSRQQASSKAHTGIFYELYSWRLIADLQCRNCFSNKYLLLIVILLNVVVVTSPLMLAKIDEFDVFLTSFDSVRLILFYLDRPRSYSQTAVTIVYTVDHLQ